MVDRSRWAVADSVHSRPALVLVMVSAVREGERARSSASCARYIWVSFACCSRASGTRRWTSRGRTRRVCVLISRLGDRTGIRVVLSSLTKTPALSMKRWADEAWLSQGTFWEDIEIDSEGKPTIREDGYQPDWLEDGDVVWTQHRVLFDWRACSVATITSSAL